MSKQVNLPEIPVKEIFTALRRTPAGKYLQNALRFSGFMIDRESPILWRRALGPNALTLSHMENLYRVMNRVLVHEENLDINSKITLLYAAICHDFGEAIIDGYGLGDIADPLKTGKEDIIEKEVFYKVLESLLIDSKTKNYLSQSYEMVIYDKSTFLYRYFRCIETYDYLLTAINVHRTSKKGVYIQNGKILVGNVLGRSVAHLLKEKNNGYSSIPLILSKNANLITAAFNYCLKEFSTAPLDGKMKTLEIEDCHTSWQRYLSQ